MSLLDGDPVSLSVPCRRCGRPAASGCTNGYGRRVPTHRVRVVDGLVAEGSRVEGGTVGRHDV